MRVRLTSKEDAQQLLHGLHEREGDLLATIQRKIARIYLVSSGSIPITNNPIPNYFLKVESRDKGPNISMKHKEMASLRQVLEQINN
jgi:hypothetical protein